MIGRKRAADAESRVVDLLLGASLILLVCLGVISTLFNHVVRLSDTWDAFYKAIGASLIASVLTYALISIIVEPRRSALQTKAAAEYATDYTNRRFQKLFETSLPTEVFEESADLKSNFRRTFIELLRTSTRYEIKGTTGRFASFRLARLANHPEIRRLDTIRLVILDPAASELLEANARLRAESAGEQITDADLAGSVETFRREIFETIVTIFDIKPRLNIEVWLHRDLPYFRSEHFDSGLLLSYYVGEAPYHETMSFPPPSRPFAVYKGAKDMSIRFSRKVLRFGSADGIQNETQLLEELASLGYPGNLDQIRLGIGARNAKLDEQLRSSGVGDDELF